MTPHHPDIPARGMGGHGATWEPKPPEGTARDSGLSTLGPKVGVAQAQGTITDGDGTDGGEGDGKAACDPATRKAHARALCVYLGLSLLVTVGLSITGDFASVTDDTSRLAHALPSLAAWGFGVGVSVLVFWMHFHACRMVYNVFILDGRERPSNVLSAVTCLSGAHIGQMTVFGVAMWLADQWMGLGSVEGETTGQFIDYIHFSFATYTSLGLGDLQPSGWLRLLTGLETITGLLCIGWSASLFVGKMGEFMEG